MGGENGTVERQQDRVVKPVKDAGSDGSVIWPAADIPVAVDRTEWVRTLPTVNKVLLVLGIVLVLWGLLGLHNSAHGDDIGYQSSMRQSDVAPAQLSTSNLSNPAAVVDSTAVAPSASSASDLRTTALC